MSTNRFFDLNALVTLLDQNIPRLISQIDRDPDSPTYGSVDRGFWMYRLHDFDSGVVQQASLTLAVLADLSEKIDLSTTIYLKTVPPKYWKSLAKAINLRNLTLMKKTGFVDEYYPGEQSFPGTVFISYAVLKSALLLGQDEVVQSSVLEKLANKILSRKASPAANQDTAAAAFLALYSQTQKWQVDQTQVVLTELLGRPDQGGKFWEYGGLDVGYSTVSLNYLGYIYADQTGPDFIPQKLTELGTLISEFITPSGNLGGEYAARSTTYFLPFGFLAAASLDKVLAGRLQDLDLVSAYQRLDDRYLIHYCLPSLAISALHLAKNDLPKITPYSSPSEWQSEYYSDFGLFRAAKQDASVFVGMNKGGSIQIESAGETTIDCGYRLLRDGQVYATCVLESSPSVSYQPDQDQIILKVTTSFRRYATLTASPFKTIALRVLGFMGSRLNDFFKRVLIKKPQDLSSTTLNRTLILDTENNLLTIEDRFDGLKSNDVLNISPPSSFRLVPSAKFFQPGEAAAFLHAQETNLDVTQESFTQKIELIR